MRAPTLIAIGLLFSAATHVAHADDHFRFEKSAAAVDADKRPLLLQLFSASRDPAGAVSLRIGFKNATNAPLDAFGILTPTDVVLATADGRRDSPAELPPSLSLMTSGQGLLPGLTNAGIVRFPAGERTGPFTLRVRGFESIPFEMSPATAFVPVPESLMTVAPNASTTSAHEALGFVRVHYENISIEGKTIEIAVAFENASHRALDLKPGLTGRQFLLVDAHGARHAPTTVSESLATAIGPTETRWEPGMRHRGWVRFVVDDPHAREKLAAVYPSFLPLRLAYDRGKTTYIAEALAAPAKLHPKLAEAQRYEDITAWCARVTTALEQRQYESFLAGFSESSGTRQEMSDFLVLLSRVPVGNLVFRILREQPISATDPKVMRGVKIAMRYRIGGTTLPLTSGITADFTRSDESGAWVASKFFFETQTPFWLLGYTGIEDSEHFILFYRPDSASRDKIAKGARQAERSWRDLERIDGLPLEARYPAFFIAREDDFRILTGRDPQFVTGAVASIFEVENDRFVAHAGGLFINDFKFLRGSNLWGMNDREQTLTHELVHLALLNESRPFTPLWVLEGTAVHFAGQNDSFSRHALRNSGLLPSLSLLQLSRRLSLADNGSLAGLENVKFEYTYSGEVVSLLIATYGEKRFLEFYQAFAAYSPSQLATLYTEQLGGKPGERAKLPVLSAYLTEHLLRTHFGRSPEEIDEAVRKQIYRRKR